MGTALDTLVAVFSSHGHRSLAVMSGLVWITSIAMRPGSVQIISGCEEESLILRCQALETSKTST